MIWYDLYTLLYKSFELIYWVFISIINYDLYTLIFIFVLPRLCKSVVRRPPIDITDSLNLAKQFGK